MSSDVRRIDKPELEAVPPPHLLDPDAIDPATVSLGVELAGVPLRTPILTASGCFASGAEMDRFYDVSELGALVVKSITREPRQGLPTPRMAETPSGMLNAIGLQNPGVDAWLARDLPWLRERGVTTVASVAGRNVDDYRTVTEQLCQAGRGTIAALEVNLSCPNVEERGLVFACSPEDSAAVIRAVREVADVPVLAKLTADVTSIVEVAAAVVEAGAHGLTLINTLLGLDIDPETGRPGLYNTYGGLSGPAIRPIALRAVHQVHQALPDVPILGCGGVRTVEDVIRFLRAGASAVSFGTVNFADPFVGQRLTAELRTWLAWRGIPDVTELVGGTDPWFTPPPAPVPPVEEAYVELPASAPDAHAPAPDGDVAVAADGEVAVAEPDGDAELAGAAAGGEPHTAPDAGSGATAGGTRVATDDAAGPGGPAGATSSPADRDGDEGTVDRSDGDVHERAGAELERDADAEPEG